MSWQGWVAVVWVLFSPIGCLVWVWRERRRPEREDRLRVERLEELLWVQLAAALITAVASSAAVYARQRMEDEKRGRKDGHAT
jgi:hypothetical protein